MRTLLLRAHSCASHSSSVVLTHFLLLSGAFRRSPVARLQPAAETTLWASRLTTRRRPAARQTAICLTVAATRALVTPTTRRRRCVSRPSCGRQAVRRRGRSPRKVRNYAARQSRFVRCVKTCAAAAHGGSDRRLRNEQTLDSGRGCCS